MLRISRIIGSKILFVAIALSMILAVGVCDAFAADQEVTLLPGSLDQPVDSSFTLTVEYDVSDNDNTLTSLGVRIHFDSTKLEYTGFENFFTTGKLADPQFQDDTSDNDGNSNTDKIVLLSYADPFGGSWPNQPLPLNLVDLLFTVKADAPAGATPVNITKVTGHTGYGFVGSGASVNITIPPGTISGQVTYSGGALGQYLIGYWDSSLGDTWYENDPVDVTFSTNGNYTLTDVPPGSYFIAGFRDSSGNWEHEDGEPVGSYTGTTDPAHQNGLPAVVALASGATETVNFTIYDWPYFEYVYVARSTFPTTGQPPTLPSREVLLAEAEVGYRGVSLVTVTVEGPDITGAAQLKDDGVLPDEVAGDGEFTGWIDTGGTVQAGPYEFTVIANSLIEDVEISLQPSALDLPTTVGPGDYVTSLPPTFDWNAVPNASEYALYIADSPNPTSFADLVLVKEDLTATQYSLTAQDPTLTEGATYYWFVEAEDQFSDNLSYSQYQSFTVDSTQPTDPTIASADPAISQWTSVTTVDLNWNPGSDPSGVAGYSWLVDKTADTVPDTLVDGADLPAQITLGALGDGDYYLHVRTKDNAGHWTSTFHYGPWMLDTAAPDAPSLALKDKTTASEDLTNDLSIEVAIGDTTATDVDGWYLSESATAPGVGDFGAKPTTFDLTGVDGSKTVYLWVKDRAGNLSSMVSKAITLDTAAPVTNTGFSVTDTSPPGYNPALTNQVKVRVVAGTFAADAFKWILTETAPQPAEDDDGWKDPAAPPDEYTFQDTANGPKTVYLWVKDEAGNIGTPATHDIELAAKPLNDPTFAISSGYEVGGVRYFNSRDISISIGDVNQYTDGSAAEVAFWIVSETDTSQPDEDSGDWTVATKPATFQLSDSDDPKDVYVWIRDASGNINVGPVMASITLDRAVPDAPTLALKDASSGSESYSNAPSIDVVIGNTTATDVDGWYLSESATAPGVGDFGAKPTTFTLTGADGLKTVNLWVKDRAGNLSSMVFQAITLDTAAPVTNTGFSVTDTSPGFDPTQTNQVRVRVVAGTFAADAFRWILTETAPQPAEDDAGWKDPAIPPTEYTFQNTTNGPKTVYLWVKDMAGNVSVPAMHAIELAAKPLNDPTFTIASGQVFDDTRYFNSRDISISIGDVNQYADGSAATVAFWIVSETATSQPDEDSADWTVDTKPATFQLSDSDSAKDVYVWIRDDLGNMNIGPVKASIILDRVVPTLSITSPGADELVTSSLFTIEGAYDGTGGGMDKVEVSIDNGTTWQAADITTTWSYLANLVIGDNPLKVKATDMAANESAVITGPIITYYEPLAIEDKPDTPPVVNVGESSDIFEVTGGDENYTWKVYQPDGTLWDEFYGPRFRFTPPADVNFAGLWAIEVVDGNNDPLFTETFGVYVPIKLVAWDGTKIVPANCPAGDSFTLMAQGVGTHLLIEAQQQPVTGDQVLDVPSESLTATFDVSTLNPGSAIVTVRDDADTEGNYTGSLRIDVIGVGTLSGQVTNIDPLVDPADGDITIWLEMLGTDQIYPSVLTLDGVDWFYEITDVPWGTYKIVATVEDQTAAPAGPEYVAARTVETVAIDQDQMTRDLSLPDMTPITESFELSVDMPGDPFAGTYDYLVLSYPSNSVVAEAENVTDDAFTINLAEGQYVLMIMAAGYKPWESYVIDETTVMPVEPALEAFTPDPAVSVGHMPSETGFTLKVVTSDFSGSFTAAIGANDITNDFSGTGTTVDPFIYTWTAGVSPDSGTEADTPEVGDTKYTVTFDFTDAGTPGWPGAQYTVAWVEKADPAEQADANKGEGQDELEKEVNEDTLYSAVDQDMFYPSGGTQMPLILKGPNGEDIPAVINIPPIPADYFYVDDYPAPNTLNYDVVTDYYDIQTGPITPDTLLRVVVSCYTFGGDALGGGMSIKFERASDGALVRYNPIPKQGTNRDANAPRLTLPLLLNPQSSFFQNFKRLSDAKSQLVILVSERGDGYPGAFHQEQIPFDVQDNGLVTLYVNHTTSIGVGSSSGAAADGGGGGGGGGGCFIATAADGPGTVIALVVLILVLLSSTGVMILRRLPRR